MRSSAEVTDVEKRTNSGPSLPVACEAWLTTWASVWGVADLPSRVCILFSRRVRASLGRCTPATGAIRLNQRLREAAPELLREVVCHEVAHVAVWMLHEGRARSHGQEWKDLMRRAGYEPRVRWVKATLSESVRAHRQPEILYVHACPVCGSHWIAKRSVTVWRCGACRNAGLEGRLEISTQPAATTETR